MFIKLSIGVFLLRLCVKRVYVWIIWISLAIISIWSVVLFFWNLFQCKPVEMQWDFRIKDGNCVSADQIVSAAYAISVMTVVSDWLYVSEALFHLLGCCTILNARQALLPIPMLWSVKMTKQAKTTVIAILGLGIL